MSWATQYTIGCLVHVCMFTNDESVGWIGNEAQAIKIFPRFNLFSNVEFKIVLINSCKLNSSIMIHYDHTDILFWYFIPPNTSISNFEDSVGLN